MLDKEEAKLLLSPYKNPIDHDLIFFRNGMMSSHLLLKDMPINVNLLTIAPIVEELVSTFLVGNLTLLFVLRKIIIVYHLIISILQNASKLGKIYTSTSKASEVQQRIGLVV